MFTLHPTLAKDTTEVIQLDVCKVLLMRDKTYPWVIMVPVIDGLRDLDDLDIEARTQVMAEIDRVSKAMKDVFRPDKMNVAALGNVVEQLHIHVIARFRDDAAWPAPIWGVSPTEDYTDAERADIMGKLHTAISVI